MFIGIFVILFVILLAILEAALVAGSLLWRQRAAPYIFGCGLLMVQYLFVVFIFRLPDSFIFGNQGVNLFLFALTSLMFITAGGAGLVFMLVRVLRRRYLKVG